MIGLVQAELGKLAKTKYGDRLVIRQYTGDKGQTYIIDGFRFFIGVGERSTRVGLKLDAEWVWGTVNEYPYADILKLIEASVDREKQARKISEVAGS